MKTVDLKVVAAEKLSMPSMFVNAYPLLGIPQMQWPVSVYRFTRADGQHATHEERGKLKNLIWQIRNEHKSSCRGLGYVVDLDRTSVAIPQRWQLPERVAIDGYDVQLFTQYVAHAGDLKDDFLVAGIFRDALRNHFKSQTSPLLGQLWQDFNSFCQMPRAGRHYQFCRKYSVSLERLGETLVLQSQLSTATLDGKTIADYYRTGTVNILSELIARKRLNRQDRQNRPIDIRVWCDQSYESKTGAIALTLANPDEIDKHAQMDGSQQRNILNLSCRQYAKAPRDVPTTHLRLILDSQITGAGHQETIISPEERFRSMVSIRTFVEGADVFGHRLKLDEMPFDITRLTSYFIPPPAIQLCAPQGAKETLLPPPVITPESLRRRAVERSRQIREHGFFQTRPINPALSWPSSFGRKRAARMRNDINNALLDQGISYQFDDFQYDTVNELRRRTENGGYDALLIVLPEGSHALQSTNDTHEQLKRCIEVPTQCIQHDNTLPEYWADRSRKELVRQDGPLARRVRNSYALSVENLFVKHGWIPFLPAQPFHYNVHVGLDVGGVHNTRAMACIGYGFAAPMSGLLFRPDEIPVEVQKAEPIPTHSLYGGLLRLFEFVYEELRSLGLPINFEKVLFFRDGAFLGDGDAWNELSALTKLQQEFEKRGWITNGSTWTGVEISKQAGGWRFFRSDQRISNPLVGQALSLTPNDQALVATTGAPYLRQGTAAPLLLKSIDIAGTSVMKEVVRDLVWEADFGLTKTDMGSRFPWVLKVADTGALQTARSYHVTGITV